MLSARCREPRPSQFSPRLQVRVISTSNIYLFIYLKYLRIKVHKNDLTFSELFNFFRESTKDEVSYEIFDIRFVQLGQINKESNNYIWL